MKQIVAVLGVCLALSACAGVHPGVDPAVSARLDSGVTSSNGGGQRVLDGTPNIGVNSGGAVSSRVNNTQGAAY